jgi:ankyrin repeat protein
MARRSRDPPQRWSLSLSLLATIFLLLAATLCRHGVNANEREDSPATRQLLHYCLSDRSDTVTAESIQEMFQDDDLARTIDINARDDASGQTCLMASVLRGKKLTVELLLFQGADPSVAEKDGYTPPHGAAFQGRTNVMAVLHEYGLSKQEYHADGYLPFHRACWGQTERHAVFVLYLLKQGIVTDIDIPSKDGKTCREMTRNPKTLKILDRYAKEAAAAAASSGGDEL